MKAFPMTIGLGLGLASAVQAAGNSSSTPIYKDPSFSAHDRAADLLAKMTWAEKIGQMGGVRRLLGTNLSFNQTSYDILSQYQNGILGESLYCYARPRLSSVSPHLTNHHCSGFGDNYNLASEVLPIANKVRERQINSTGIPYITVTDSLNSIYNTGGTLFPPSLSLGASFNIPLYEQVVGAIRDENVAVGTRWVLSPELELAKEPHGGRVGEM